MGVPLPTICEGIRSAWHRAAPAAVLICGLDLAESRDPVVMRLRRQGAHFGWVASPVLGVKFWDAHLGVVVDPETGLGRAGFHISRTLRVSHGHLEEALLTIREAVLDHSYSTYTGEEQWNSEEIDAVTEDGQVALVEAVLHIHTMVSSTITKPMPPQPKEDSHDQ